VFFSLFQYVKDQFDSTGDPEFVIDAEQIVAHRVLSDEPLPGSRRAAPRCGAASPPTLPPASEFAAPIGAGVES
jgi:hypothetical protein